MNIIINPDIIYGDCCVPMSCDDGKTWCAEYDYIQAHPELIWKSFIEIAVGELSDRAEGCTK